MEPTYKIICFYAQRGKESEVVKTGLSLEDAERHCSRKTTSGPGWFHGFEREDKTDEEIMAETERTLDQMRAIKAVEPRFGVRNYRW
jgi:hypothetical protein